MRDKALTEAMGECWHETVFHEYGLTIETIRGEFIEKKCTCGRTTRTGKSYSAKDQQPLCSNQSFSTWEGFGKLFEWFYNQRFYSEIMWWHTEREEFVLYDGLINPDKFANAVYEYLKEMK